jgi:hypothetical protein
MSSPASQIAPEKTVSAAPRHWRQDVSQNSRAAQRDFAELTAEEKITYRKWSRATLVFYGVLVCVIAELLIATSQMAPSTNVDNKAAYSAIASVGRQNSR